MARENQLMRFSFSFRYLCHFALLLSLLSFVSFLFRHNTSLCSCLYDHNPNANTFDHHHHNNETIDLLRFSSAWNHLTFPSKPKKTLKIAVVVKKWPRKSQAGGLERHALTLHLALANRGHEVHVFTAASPSFPEYQLKNLLFHLSEPTAAGYLDQASVSQQLQTQNASGRPFDVIHTESVGLLHTRAKNLRNVVASWHGIAYETFHSDIIQELLRQADIAAATAAGTEEEQPPPSSPALTERAKRVVEEVKFFQRYAHHVATSDHCGDVLKRIYMIPEERVHIILNGVDENVFKPDISKRESFREKFGVISVKNKKPPLVLGIAGRLVRDKGHPLMFAALKRVFEETKEARENVVVLVAGDGPWGNRYRDLGSNNVIVLGPLDQEKLAGFYNAIDVFVNPTLRAQGLDHTLLEAMVSGKPVLATRLASITGSVVVGPHLGYTFSPNVESLSEAISRVVSDGIEELQRKGKEARERSLRLFTANKMADSYERFFLCISDQSFCTLQASNI
ncbi:Glycosyl transferase family 1 [Arabidopsis thaliana x Arabidopsis arenosa]|uniref:Glycosyl transferase family 1 n=1 Tax=Arabidopsis thaliana x Arabidopsis arenosa TaxID=1240361 RepID=A0A8T1XSQ1_9BRAS|nr:Glycosyl transferase family 1 [Arabidopsis thaliana x Arabidopsis arenosa]